VPSPEAVAGSRRGRQRGVRLGKAAGYRGVGERFRRCCRRRRQGRRNGAAEHGVGSGARERLREATRAASGSTAWKVAYGVASESDTGCITERGLEGGLEKRRGRSQGAPPRRRRQGA
jgi:hypothetical protein